MGQQASKSTESTTKAIQATTGAATGAVMETTVAVKDAVAAVGAEDREAVRIQKSEHWGRVEEGDTLWDLSEKYLGDGTQWETLRAACRRELGTNDPLLLLPGSHVTEACVARAQAELQRGR